MRTIALFLLLVVPSFSFADTIHVPGDYSTIQAGIDAAVNGDTVLVSPGTYVENIDFLGKTIEVRSLRGPGSTVIDGSNPVVPEKGSVVCFINGEEPEAILDGFTLTHGQGTYIYHLPIYGYCGGGIVCHKSSPTIKNNIIIGNRADWGGGIACWADASPLVHCNLIRNNFAYRGGGVQIASKVGAYSRPLFTCNFIAFNSASGGGGIECQSFGSAPVMVNNTVYRNFAGISGGAIRSIACKLVIYNSIFWDNECPDGVAPEIWVGGGTELTIDYCVIKDKDNTVFKDGSSDIYWGSTILEDDPQFVDPNNIDGHLRYTSPCREAGDSTVAELPDTDFDGNPRIAYGNVDIGADEFHPHLYYTGTATPGESIDLKFIGIPDDTVRLWIGSGVLDPPQHHPLYGNWYLEAPILLGIILGNIPSPDGVYVLPVTIPPDYTPWNIPLQAGIGMKFSNLCVVGAGRCSN